MVLFGLAVDIRLWRPQNFADTSSLSPHRDVSGSKIMDVQVIAERLYYSFIIRYLVAFRKARTKPDFPEHLKNHFASPMSLGLKDAKVAWTHV